MKIKSLLCASIVAAVSVNAFAVEIYKGKVVSHKEWSTGNAKATFKVGKAPANLFSKNNKMLKTQSDSAYIYSMADVIKGVVGSPANVTGTNSIYISNQSSTTATYNYTLSVCSYLDERSLQCAYTFDQIELEPEGYFTDSMQSSLQVTFAKPGVYNSIVSTHLSKGDGFELQAGSTSSGVVEISKS